MKKSINFIIFILFITINYAYVYISGNNVILPNQKIKIIGNNENQIMMKVYKIIYPEKIFLEGYPLEKVSKRFVMDKIITGKKIEYSFKISEPGYYFITFEKNNKIISSGQVMVTNVDFINIYDGKNLFVKTYDSNGNNVKADIYLITDKIEKFSNISELKMKIMNLKKIVVKYKNSYRFTRVYKIWKSYKDNPVKIITDRNIYKPGQTVKFKILSFLKNNNVYNLSNIQKISYKIKDPSNIDIKTNEIETKNGMYDGSVFISKDAPLGYYNIELTCNNEKYYYGFYVQDYEKPEYKINISSDKTEYYLNDTINFKINLEYYNGNPVGNAKIAFYIYANNYPNSQLAFSGINYTNEKGVLNIPVKINKKIEGDYTLKIITIDENQRQLKDEFSVKVYSGNYKITSDKGYYTSLPNKDITISGTVTDRKNIFQNGTIKLFTEDSTLISTAQVLNGRYTIKANFKKEKYYNLKLLYKNSEKSLNIYISNNVKVQKKLINNFKKMGNEITFDVSRIKGNGVFILSGNNLYDIKIFNEKNTSYTFKLPKNTLERNLFLNAIIFTKNGIYKDSKEIDLNKINSLKYNYTLKLEKNLYKPKENIKLSIDAEQDGIFLLNVVDESLYAISKDNTRLLESLYPKLYSPSILINTGNSYIYFPYSAKYFDIEQSHKFASYKKSEEVKVNTREYFPETALWLTVKTKNKHAEINFKNPDTLTTWRITSYGISNEKMQKQSIKYKTNLDFYIRPILPNFAIKGDTINFDIVVYNSLEKEITIPYKNISKNIINIYPESGQVTVSAKSNKVIHLQMKAINIGKEIIEFDYDKDIVKLPFEVKSQNLINEKIDLINTKSGYLVKKGSYYREFSIDSLIDDTLNYLSNYPYRCSEQTISTSYPLLIAYKNGYTVKNMDIIAKQAIQRLYKYQATDGGWGWWNYDSSNPELTAYVMEGIYELNKNYYISKSVINKGLEFLKKHINSGYIYYVLKLYGININYKPITIYDKVYYAFFNDTLSYVLNDIEEINDIAFLKYKDNNYYYSNVDINSALLKLLLKKDPNNPIIMKIFKYLIMQKKSYSWYSTKENARMLELLIKFKDNFKFGKEDIFKKAQEDTLIKNKYIEIKSVENINSNINNGIDLEKNLYKKINIPVSKDNKIQYVDAFININEKIIPTKVDFIETKFIVKNNLIIIKNNYEKGDWIIEPNLKIGYDGNFVYINNLKFKNIKEIQKTKDYIYLLNDDLIEYNTQTNKYKTILKNVYSFSILNNNPIAIIKLNEKFYVYFKDVYKKIDKYYNIDTLNNKIYLFRNNTYEYDFKENTLKKLFPVSGDKIININKNSITLNNIKFQGNENFIGAKNGSYKVTFENKKINLKNGDILKISLNLSSIIPNYINVEDRLPGNVQILKRYQEKVLQDNNKFYSYWYDAWDYWYSGREFRKDRVSFFSNGYTNGKFYYYFKFINSGKIKILPAFGSTMYWSGTYGTSKEYNLEVQ
ncbi:UPF0192 protein [Tepiditoga spiralis]|uniref:UPF0192 protein n=1 Tax=Tepiditoga spiralis TaxID=2108365 RepID=A0A7G1G6Z3_9BACT|nr:MG2 domain-containing protein [Tepiditoga spiralis]BBE31975.1 UPF0192 protein [Tepiditoga spiralis]